MVCWLLRTSVQKINPLSLFGDDHYAFQMPFLCTDVRSSHNNLIYSLLTSARYRIEIIIDGEAGYSQQIGNDRRCIPHVEDTSIPERLYQLYASFTFQMLQRLPLFT